MSIATLPDVVRLIDLAIAEDLGRGDVTTESVIGVDRTAVVADLVARQALVVFGVDIACEVFRRIDPEVEIEVEIADGGRASPGDVVLVVRGPADPILRAERTALNFMQRLSGVATMASRFAEAVAGTSCRVVDTRKTTPGYRVLEKAAVLAGGAHNHRADLGSGILIKDNHIAACGSVTTAVERARARAPHPLRIEVEVETDAELDEALAARAEIVLLDNMTVDQVRAAADKARAAGVLVEVSGGITLETVGGYARAGADLISSGAITHSAGSVDLALDFRARERAR
jgi:nicotinate-nucleotide pyrophosphorylase (carboxylating)